MAMNPIVFENFSGGLNTRDTPEELASNEIPDAQNVTMDEKGHIVKRLGYSNHFPVGNQVGSGTPKNMFFWKTQNKLVTQVGTGTHLDTLASFTTWSTTDRIAMAEMNGLLFMNHPVDGLKYYNGTTVTAVASAPKGNAIAVWQNRLWSNDSAASARLWFSPIGDPTAAWPGTNWVDVKEKDSDRITALGGASGTDITGRPGLLVFKHDSAYRVNDSATGEYTTIDSQIGCGSNISLVNAGGRTYVLCERGIFSTDGISSMREDSQLVSNFFNKRYINMTKQDLFAAGRFQDRLYFSLPRVGSTRNDMVFEIHTEQGWIMRHTNAASCYVSTDDDATGMLMGDVLNPYVYDSHVGGSDAFDGAQGFVGQPIVSFFQTNWQNPLNFNSFRVRKLRVTGNGIFSVTPMQDFGPVGNLAPVSVDILGEQAYYDQGFNYNGGNLYSTGHSENLQDFWSIGVFRSIGFRIDETSTKFRPGPFILGSSTVSQRGAWEISSFVGTALDLGDI